MRGVKKAVETGIQFTIIMKLHKTGKGYIIMEIMSTNVIFDTIYRGEMTKKPTYFGVGLRKVYIMFILKTVEKLRKYGQNQKKLDFLEINVIMYPTIKLIMYPIVTI